MGRVYSLEPYPQECKIASRMQPLYITVLFKLWVIIHVVNRMITFLTDRTFCPESPDGSLPPMLTMITGWNSRLKTRGGWKDVEITCEKSYKCAESVLFLCLVSSLVVRKISRARDELCSRIMHLHARLCSIQEEKPHLRRSSTV